MAKANGPQSSRYSPLHLDKLSTVLFLNLGFQKIYGFGFICDLKNSDMSFVGSRSFTDLKKCILVIPGLYLTITFSKGILDTLTYTQQRPELRAFGPFSPHCCVGGFLHLKRQDPQQNKCIKYCFYLI